MAHLTTGGKNGGTAILAAVQGSPERGRAVWDLPKTYDPAKHFVVLPFLGSTVERSPLVTVFPRNSVAANAVPFAGSVVRVVELDAEGEPTGVELDGVVVDFASAPKGGESVHVTYWVEREH